MPKLLRVKFCARRALSLMIIVSICLLALPLFPSVSAQNQSASAAKDAQAKVVPTIAPGNAYRLTNLISDLPGFAPVQDPLLRNPWGIAVKDTSPFWIANNQSGRAQLVRGDVGGAPVVLNPSPQNIGSLGLQLTGVVGNPTSDFKIAPPGGGSLSPASFIFASTDGIVTSINAWNSDQGSNFREVIDTLGNWTGLAIGANAAGNRLYVADFRYNQIHVFDGNFSTTSVSGGFPNSGIPAGFAPFNIQNLGGSLYVTYAKVGPDGDVINGSGLGYVRKFNTDGELDSGFAIDAGALDAPWGLAIAPASFGIYGGALLVGNFSDNGTIHAYDATTGEPRLLDTGNALKDESNNDIVIEHLWALQFGSGGDGGDPNTLYFTAGIGDERHGLFGKLNPTTVQATSLIQFATDSSAINEGADHIDITVTRAGDASGTATVNYSTLDLQAEVTATQKTDFEIAGGTLTFNPGETSKTFRILLVDDKFVEGDEVVKLALWNPTGTRVGLGTPNVATLTINDNDAALSFANPIDDTPFFVRQQFLDSFNRAPDSVSSDFYANQITACGSNAQCIYSKRAEVSAAIFNSLEFQTSGSLIARTYKAAFGLRQRGEELDEITELLYGEFEKDIQGILRNTTIGLPDDPQLETNKQAFFASFVTRPEFLAAFQTTIIPAAFANTLFSNAGFTPTTAQRQAVIDEFAGASNTADQGARARALRRVAENVTFIQNDANRDLVLLGYFNYMRRDPDAPSFHFLLQRLETLQSNLLLNGLSTSGVLAREAARYLIASGEYRHRFGFSGALTNTAPVANNDTVSTNANTPVIINVLSNDTDFEGDFLTISSVTPGTGGTPTINFTSSRSITFTPTPGFVGAANFQYKITDNGTTDVGNLDSKTSTATVTVNVISGGTFQFTVSTLAVGEGAGKATLTVTRSGDTAPTVSVEYATAPDPLAPDCTTVNGHASDRCDYNGAGGVLTFGAGETSKSFDIFINDDAYVEALPETFSVSLSNPKGTNFVIGSTPTVTVTINDNDSSSGANPIDNIQFFVRQMYIDFLAREPDTTGFNNWVNTLQNCPNGGFGLNNPQCDRVRVASGFYPSQEFGGRGYFTYRFYDAALGRLPTYREFVRDLQRVGGNQTDAQSEASKQAFIADFMASAEFQTIYGGLTTSSQAAAFVAKLESKAGVTLPEPLRSQLISQMASGSKTPAETLRAFIESQTVFDRFFNRGFVSLLYFGFLRRDPDTVGFNNWLTQINQTGDSRPIVFGFIFSIEYRSRFGTPQ